MAITAETFQAIVKSIRADQSKTLQPGFVGKAVILPRTDKSTAHPVDVLVRDLTPTEISFVHNKSLKTGEHFILCVRESGQTRGIVCAVTRWHPLADGQVSITAAFAREAISLTKPCEDAEVDRDHVKSIEAKLRGAIES